MAALTSSHVSDAFLQPFLLPSFDPASFLNDALPSLSTASAAPSTASKPNAAPLAEVSSQTQNLLSQLNAHTSRLSNILTQMTDDILRSGGRLAYQVEVLRGETLGLSDTLTDSLQHNIANFVPEGFTTALPEAPGNQNAAKTSESADTHPAPPEQPTGPETATNAPAPGHLDQLRTLTQVRARLESVIQVFGDAMHWTIPPSELSLASSLISVSAPEPGADSQSREEKGRAYAERLRREVADLVAGTTPEHDGHAAAMARIQALRDLALVWKGTSEEKARVKFVEGLVKLADDRQKAVQKELSAASRQRDAHSVSPTKRSQRGAAPEKSYSILDRLYLD